MIGTFNDLVFVPHPNGMGGVQCLIYTDNGYTISIVGGPTLYGDGINTFEVACWESIGNKEWIQLSPYDNVIGHRTKDEVLEIILNISSGIMKQYV
jgi:hypothetical protein